jgi:hypothetical protein
LLGAHNDEDPAEDDGVCAIGKEWGKYYGVREDDIAPQEETNKVNDERVFLEKGGFDGKSDGDGENEYFHVLGEERKVFDEPVGE